MNVVFSKLALSELDEILGYIAERSPLGAEHMERRIRRALDYIFRHPEAAEAVAERPEVRRILRVTQRLSEASSTIQPTRSGNEMPA
jgi:plasmid stabilization system protein ParE